VCGVEYAIWTYFLCVFGVHGIPCCDYELPLSARTPKYTAQMGHVPLFREAILSSAQKCNFGMRKSSRYTESIFKHIKRARVCGCDDIVYGTVRERSNTHACV